MKSVVVDRTESGKVSPNPATLTATDIDASKRSYRKMGLSQIFDSPRYARFECPGGDAIMSLLEVEAPPAGAAGTA